MQALRKGKQSRGTAWAGLLAHIFVRKAAFKQPERAES